MARTSATRTAILLAAVGLGSGCATAGRRVVSPAMSDGFFVAGYHAYWTGDAWTDYPLDVLDQIFFFELEVGADGRLSDAHGWPREWLALESAAIDAGVAVVATVSMHDADAFEALFAVATSVDRLVETLATMLAASPALSGLHLDFEVFRPVDPDVRDGFTAFVVELRSRMRALDPGLSLSVFTLAFDDDDVYNERALAALSDYLVVQGYDLHHPTDTETGPLAALAGWGRLNWETIVDRFLGFGVPARKILMAVPLYGYEWPAEAERPGAPTRGEATIIPFAPPPDVVPELPRARARVAEHGFSRDAASGSPYYAFADASGWFQGWFDDEESLRAKYAFVRERGLGGVAIFPLAYGDEPLWDDLRAAFPSSRR